MPTPVPVTLTPGSPLATVRQLLNSVTPLVPLKLTNVSTQQPYISADSLQIPGSRSARTAEAQPGSPLLRAS